MTMTTSHDSKDLEAQTVEREGLHQIYSHLRNLISLSISQLPRDGFPTVRYARMVEINKPMRRGNVKVRVL